MKRLAIILTLCFVPVCAAYAAIVTSSSGRHASVSSAFQPHAQCFIRKLDAAGYHIKFMTGYAKRSNVSAHPTGNAIDINQTGFGRVTHRFPAGYLQMASECGVYSGSHFGDYGHFEMPRKYGYVGLVRYAHRGRVHYASHSHHHYRHYASYNRHARVEASAYPSY
jgi:hypothetical protein